MGPSCTRRIILKVANDKLLTSTEPEQNYIISLSPLHHPYLLHHSYITATSPLHQLYSTNSTLPLHHPCITTTPTPQHPQQRHDTTPAPTLYHNYITITTPSILPIYLRYTSPTISITSTLQHSILLLHHSCPTTTIIPHSHLSHRVSL